MALTARAGLQTSIPSPEKEGSAMCPVKQVPGAAVNFVRDMLRRDRKAEREASR